MNEDNSIVHLRQPDAIDDPLTTLLRSGARRLLEQAIDTNSKESSCLSCGWDWPNRND